MWKLYEPVFDADLDACIRDARAERDTGCVQPQVRATCIKVNLGERVCVLKVSGIFETTCEGETTHYVALPIYDYRSRVKHVSFVSKLKRVGIIERMSRGLCFKRNRSRATCQVASLNGDKDGRARGYESAQDRGGSQQMHCAWGVKVLHQKNIAGQTLYCIVGCCLIAPRAPG